MLGPVVLGQDEETEIHVQAIIQSGRRQLDIRIWRRGPAGFAPSRSALTLEEEDLAVLLDGIDELLEMSQGATQVAKVVRDRNEERRLRAETEPFGTHFMIRFGFWQRVRDSWRPTGDGLRLAAEQLVPLQETLKTLQPHLTALADEENETIELVLGRESAYRWPAPGADWLSSTPDQLAFHPRGVRITASIVEEDEERHRLLLQQWRRDDALWTPGDVSVSIGLADVEALLAGLKNVRDRKQQEPIPDRDYTVSEGTTLRLHVELEPPRSLSILECTIGESDFQPRLTIPMEFMPHFGRLLVEAGNLLLSRLSSPEREELRQREDVAVPEEIVAEAVLNPGDAAHVEPGEVPRRHAYATAEELVAKILSPEPQEEPAEISEEPAPEPEDEDVRRLAPLGEVRLGRHSVFLYDLREDQKRFMSMQFDGRALDVPVDDVEQLIEDLRQMYYQTLRGRRGQLATKDDPSAVRMSIHHRGSSTYVILERDEDGELTSLLFPIAEVPAFLNAAEKALARFARESVES